MRIIHVATVGMTAEMFLQSQCAHLRELGHEVGFVFSPGPQADLMRTLGFSVEEVFISRQIRPSDFTSVARLARYFQRVQPDLVHTHTSKAGVVGRIAARLAGVQHVVHTIHGFPFIEGQAFVTFHAYVAIERMAARLTDLLLSQSQEDIANARRLGIQARRGYPLYLGNGLDVQRFRPDRLLPDQRSALRQRFAARDRPLLTTIGRLTAEKGFFELIDALGSLQDLSWSAIIIGPDEGAGAEMQRRIDARGLAGRVHLVGGRDDVPDLLAISDLFTLPSYREGLPRSLMEAQATGLPAVATEIRGCREVVIHGETGFLVPPRDADALASGLRALLIDPELRARLGAAARLRAERVFDERLGFVRLEAAYNLLTHPESDLAERSEGP